MNVFELFKEEAAGVGVIASKKQAKDPRYSHSLTVDVRPDTPKKNRKALGLTEAPREDGSFENRDDYYKEMYPMALKAVSKLGLQIPPELLVTQWGFESGWGSKVSGDNNFFGIKANKGYEGNSKEVTTHEYIDGKKVKIKDKFRSYDNLDDAVDDYVNFIKNNPRYTKAGVFDAKNSEEYMAALQKAGYASDDEYMDKILKQEKITKKQIAKVVPPEEQEKLKAELPTVAVTPATDTPEYDAFGNVVTDKGFDPANKKADQAARIARRQSAEDQKRAELEKRSKSRGQSVSPSLDAERRDIGKDTASTTTKTDTASTTKTDTSVTTTPAKEEEKSYAEMGKVALPDSLSVKRKELEDAKAQGASQAEIDRLEQAVQYNLDVQAGKDVVGGVGTLSTDETEYLKAKQNALMQGKDDVTSIADDDLNRRRAEAYANQQEKMGNTGVADFARLEAKRHEALRMQKLTKGITWGQGTLAQQEQQMKQWDKTKSEGGDPAQSWKGGVVTDPDKLKDWQKRNQEADKLQKEKGEWNITKTIDDYRADVSSWGQELQKAEAEKEPVDMSQAGQAGTDDFMKSGPGTVPEKPAVVTTPTKPEVDDISGDFKTTKQRQHYRDKYSALTPAFMMDEPDKQAVIARERLRNKAGELMRTNPAEWNKLYGGDKLGKAIEKAEQDAYAKFDEPQTTQKPAPIVDKSTTYKPDRNANLANNKIGDAYGTLSKPNSAIGQATVSTTPRTGPGANANTQTFDAEKQKAERQAKIDQQKAERQAKIDQQKAEQAAKKAEQKAKQEARKAEDERKRQEQKAEQERRVSGSTFTVGAPVKEGESAIFRAIMRK